MTLENIIEKFDEKYNDLAIQIEQEWGANSKEDKTFMGISDFLRSSYSELLGGIVEDCKKDYLIEIEGYPSEYNKGLEQAISIINSKLPKEDSINPKQL